MTDQNTSPLNEVQTHLLAALRVMRSACDDAEREIMREKSGCDFTADMPRINSTLHALNWSMANASSHIGNAMRRFEFNEACKEFEAKKE